MPDLYLCTRCKMPFLAEDKWLVARRGGDCANCAKIKILQAFGLPPDFLIRGLGPIG